MSTATKTGSDVIAELEELKAKLVSTERERDEALAAPACKRQAMSRTWFAKGPSTNPRFADSCRIVLLDGRPTRRVIRGHHSWGPGSHSETDVNDGRVRRPIESVVEFQDNAITKVVGQF